MAKVLGIDASTQSLSAVVIDTESGTIVKEFSVNFGKRLPQYGAPSGFVAGPNTGEVFADPRMWLNALEILLGELHASGLLKGVAAVCGAGQQHGSVYLDERWFATLASLHEAHGDSTLSMRFAPCLTRALSPIWMDTSTAEECHEIARAVGGTEKVCTLSGSIPIERFTGPQIRRFYKKAPQSYANTARIHLVSSFLCSVLCGTDAPIDTGDGAGMNLLNLKTWDWDNALLEATAPHLREKLPPVAKGDTQTGMVAPYFVKKFGFSPETPVLIFTGDNPSSLVGMGASHPGKMVISLGTSDTVFAAIRGHLTDPDGYGHTFGNPMGGQMSLQCFVNGSLAREAVKERFGYDWTDFTRAIFHTSAGNHRQMMLPFLRPEISPRVNINRFVLKGTPAFERWEEPAAAIRACVEGQFVNMKLRSVWMSLSPTSILLTGGASRDDGIAQIAADVFQSPVERLQTTASVALGAAMRAARHCLNIPIGRLEESLCRPYPDRTVQPCAPSCAYDDLCADFASLLAKESGRQH